MHHFGFTKKKLKKATNKRKTEPEVQNSAFKIITGSLSAQLNFLGKIPREKAGAITSSLKKKRKFAQKRESQTCLRVRKHSLDKQKGVCSTLSG